MRKFVIILTVISILLGLNACQQNTSDSPTVSVSSLRDVSAIKLNFRFENDVPAPSETTSEPSLEEERNNAIQVDFDQNRPGETLERTIPSPDKNRFLAIYQKLDDLQATYRLDMYSSDGKLLRKITPDGLAVYYPDTIIWSPNSNNVAFVGMVRLGQAIPVPTPTPDAPIPPNLDNENTNLPSENNTETDANTDANTSSIVEQPKQVLTFRTEQIYICNSDGGDLKPLTQNEGYRYFYFVWSPDSSMLVSLVATWREFDFMNARADQQGEVFVPMGRPRLVEKTGRIRLLDDNLTNIHPVWSPDSSKVAIAFNKEVRIYDAIGDAPTQAAIPLHNPLSFAAQAYDKEMQRKEATENPETNANTNSNSNTTSTANVTVPQGVDTLPDESTLVSFNPIVQLQWTEDKMLYLETGYIKDFKDSTQSTRSYLRWHRLLFSPQAIKLD